MNFSLSTGTSYACCTSDKVYATKKQISYICFTISTYIVRTNSKIFYNYIYKSALIHKYRLCKKKDKLIVFGKASVSFKSCSKYLRLSYNDFFILFPCYIVYISHFNFICVSNNFSNHIELGDNSWLNRCKEFHLYGRKMLKCILLIF